MAEVFADRAESTLAAGIAIGAVSLTVQAGHGARFPATGDFSVLLEKASDPAVYELVKATARAVDTITITATTLAWAAADKVVHVIDKRALDAALASKQALSDHDPFVGAAVYRTIDQSINTSTHTAVQFDAENEDSTAFHDTATNNSRITIPAGKAGRYLFIGHGVFAANATGRRITKLQLNGTTTISEAQEGGLAADTSATLVVSKIRNMTAGDYVELLMWQDSGAALNVLGGNASGTYLSAIYLGAA